MLRPFAFCWLRSAQELPASILSFSRLPDIPRRPRRRPSSTTLPRSLPPCAANMIGPPMLFSSFSSRPRRFAICGWTAGLSRRQHSETISRLQQVQRTRVLAPHRERLTVSYIYTEGSILLPLCGSWYTWDNPFCAACRRCPAELQRFCAVRKDNETLWCIFFWQ